MVKNGKIADTHSFGPLATAIKNYDLSSRDLERLISGGTDKGTADVMKEIKHELFAQIRDAVMGVRVGNDFYMMSPIFKHFDERHIMKLDYNEGDRVFTKDELFREIWDMESIGDIATVTVHIKKIREKIELDTSKPQYIETIWGVGYRFKI